MTRRTRSCGSAAVDDALAAYEALLHNGIAPSDIAFAGESAGGGLAIATLVNARDHGLPQPAAAFVMSPYADLTLAGTTMETRREVGGRMRLLQPWCSRCGAIEDLTVDLVVVRSAGADDSRRRVAAQERRALTSRTSSSVFGTGMLWWWPPR